MQFFQKKTTTKIDSTNKERENFTNKLYKE
jgi:hypothetical protein